MGDGVVECGVGKANVAACGERGESGGVATQQKIKVAAAKIRVATEEKRAGEADLIGSVAGVAESQRGLGESGISVRP